MLRDRNADGDPSTTQLGLDNMGLEERTLYSYDANYNVTALWQDGANGWRPVERYSYDPYGQVTVLHGGQGYDPEVDGVTILEWMPKSANPDGSPCVSRYDNEILYCGYRFDWETGLYNVRHRIYHPTLGRWTRRDPKGYVDGLSLIQYAISRPTISVDPSGEGVKCDSVVSKETFLTRKAGHLYTCNCGWVDGGHFFGFIDKVVKTYMDLEKGLKNEKSTISTTTGSAYGSATVSVTATKEELQKFAEDSRSLKILAAWMVLTSSYYHEYSQGANLGFVSLLMIADTVMSETILSHFSGEDMVSNALGAAAGLLVLNGFSRDAAIKIVIGGCGETLNAKEGAALCKQGFVPGIMVPAFTVDGKLNVITYNSHQLCGKCKNKSAADIMGYFRGGIGVGFTKDSPVKGLGYGDYVMENQKLHPTINGVTKSTVSIKTNF